MNEADFNLAGRLTYRIRPPEDYPLGESTMPVSLAANWNENDEAGIVVTNRSDDYTSQTLHIGGHIEERAWDPDDVEWAIWRIPMTTATANNTFVRQDALVLDNDLHAEAAPMDDYPNQITRMYVSDVANWNGTGVEGFVVTERSFVGGGQRLYASDGVLYKREWNGSVWCSWSSGGSSDAATLEGEDGDYYLDRTNHSGTQALGTITGHDKAAHDALDIDADTLDGISSAGFVQTGDYEDADVLAKVKNVDGAGSGLDADLLDGNSSAFYATATGLIRPSRRHHGCSRC